MNQRSPFATPIASHFLQSRYCCPVRANSIIHSPPALVAALSISIKLKSLRGTSCSAYNRAPPFGGTTSTSQPCRCHFNIDTMHTAHGSNSTKRFAPGNSVTVPPHLLSAAQALLVPSAAQTPLHGISNPFEGIASTIHFVQGTNSPLLRKVLLVPRQW